MIALLLQGWRKKQCTVPFSTCKDDSDFQDLDVTAHINFKDKCTPDCCVPNCPVSTASRLHWRLNLEQLRNLAHFYFLFPLSAFAFLHLTVQWWLRKQSVTLHRAVPQRAALLVWQTKTGWVPALLLNDAILPVSEKCCPCGGQWILEQDPNEDLLGP